PTIVLDQPHSEVSYIPKERVAPHNLQKICAICGYFFFPAGRVWEKNDSIGGCSRSGAAGDFAVEGERLFVFGDFVGGEDLTVAGDLLLHSLDEILHFPFAGADRAVDLVMDGGRVRVEKSDAIRFRRGTC